MNRAKEGPLSVTVLPAGLRGCSLKHLRRSVADDNQQHWQNFGPVCQSSSKKKFPIDQLLARYPLDIHFAFGWHLVFITDDTTRAITHFSSFFLLKENVLFAFVYNKKHQYLENVISQGVQRDKKYKYNVFPTNAWYLKSLLNYSVY